ncbi:MAG: hypothetical protein II943_12130 [Victivallales bacterium]|nr:hypothetical protein [Victivallales bacterium]
MQKPPLDLVEQLRNRLDPTPCALVRQLVASGHEAYIVGGAIRDLLLNETPKDYDIATSATPEEIRKVFGRRRCRIIGRRFRLVHVYANGDLFEVSTFRREPNHKERQGRRSAEGEEHIIWNDNCFGTLEDDATRRDFTANSLYFDVTGPRGIVDFWGGYQDILDRRVRCIGQPVERLEEDPVRMLRALKLVGQFGFRLENKLDEAIREMAPAIRLASTSRLFEELLKILKNPFAGQTLQVMHEHGFLAHFWPTLEECWNEQEGELVRHLLKLRGEAIQRGHYSGSRGLALSTVAIPFLMAAMNPENPTAFWTGSLAFNSTALRALRLVFEGFQLPNAFAHRILEIASLVPWILNDTNRKRTLQHIEYRYGRALLALLIQAFGWEGSKLLGNYPEFSPAYGSWENEDAPEDEADAPATAFVPGADGAMASAEDGGEPKRVRHQRSRRKAPTETSTEATPSENGDLPAPPASDASPVAPATTSPDEVPQKPAKARLLPLKKESSTESPAVQLPRPIKRLVRKATASPASEKLLPLQKTGPRVALPDFVPAPVPEQEVGASFLPLSPKRAKASAKPDSITFSPTGQAASRKRREK